MMRVVHDVAFQEAQRGQQEQGRLNRHAHDIRSEDDNARIAWSIFSSSSSRGCSRLRLDGGDAARGHRLQARQRDRDRARRMVERMAAAGGADLLVESLARHAFVEGAGRRGGTPHACGSR